MVSANLGSFIVQSRKQFQTMSCRRLSLLGKSDFQTQWETQLRLHKPQEKGEEKISPHFRQQKKKIFIDLKIHLLWAENQTSDSRCLPLSAGSHKGGHFYCNNIKSQLIHTLDNTSNKGCTLHLSAASTSKAQLYPPLRAPDNVQVLDSVWCCGSWGTGNEIAVITTPERADKLGGEWRVFQKPLCDLSALLCAKNNNNENK